MRNVSSSTSHCSLDQQNRLLAEYVLPLAHGTIMRVIQTLPQTVSVEHVLAWRHPGSLHGAQTNGANVIPICQLVPGRLPESAQDRVFHLQSLQAILYRILHLQVDRQVKCHEGEAEVPVAEQNGQHDGGQGDGVVAEDDGGVECLQRLESPQSQQHQERGEQFDENLLCAHVIRPRDESVRSRWLVVLQPLLQTEHQ